MVPTCPSALPVRIATKIVVSDHVHAGVQCWDWTAAANARGYGRIRWGDDHRLHLAHRVIYTLLVGPIPDGLVIDHLCGRPCCVNPSHLDPVPQRVNVLRGRWRLRDRCRRGHDLTLPGAVYVAPGTGGRQCWACRRDATARWAQVR